MSTPDTRVAPGVLADAISQRVLDHPAVAHLDGGPFGTVASYLPGRRVVGVRVAEEERMVHLAVVLWLGWPVLPVVAELRQAVTEIAGPVRVDVTVADLHSLEDEPPEPAEPAAEPSPPPGAGATRG